MTAGACAPSVYSDSPLSRLSFPSVCLRVRVVSLLLGLFCTSSLSLSSLWLFGGRRLPLSSPSFLCVVSRSVWVDLVLAVVAWRSSGYLAPVSLSSFRPSSSRLSRLG